MFLPFQPHRFGQKKADVENLPPQFKASHEHLHLKAVGEDGIGVVEGYGSVWDAVDSYGERVKKGAFKNSLKAWKKSGRKVPMLWQHRSDTPIGVWDEASEDDKGLLLRGRVNLQTQRGKEAWSDMDMGSVTGLSIGYYEIIASSWDRPGTEPRDLIELDLREVSPVTFPALREAQIDAVKSRLIRGERATEREFEADMRERHRLTRAEAEFVNRHGYKAFLARDAQGGVVDEALTELKAERIALPDFDLPNF